MTDFQELQKRIRVNEKLHKQYQQGQQLIEDLRANLESAVREISELKQIIEQLKKSAVAKQRG